MKRLMLSIFLVVLLVGTISAFEFDNVLTYEEDDMKVTFTNAFNLPLIGYDLGTIELKSHSSVTEVKKFGFGKEEVVMWYDFEGWELYENGLGEVIFTNERTGEIIEKDYYFVEWVVESVNVNDYKEVCNVLKNGTIECYQEILGTHLEERGTWVKYDSNDIPARNTRIGLKTYVGRNDYIDGVWTIAGKEVSKHAIWEGGLNVGLIHYWNFDEASGNIFDQVGTLNFTNAGGQGNQAGQIGTSYFFDDALEQDAQTANSGLTGDIALSFSVWFKKFNNTGASQDVFDMGVAGGGVRYHLSMDGTDALTIDVSGSLSISLGTISDTDWHHVVVSYDGAGTGRGSIDGGAFINDSGNLNLGDGPIFLARQINSAPAGLNGNIDEFGMWNRTLTDQEMRTLYNGGMGCGQGDEGCAITAPTVTLNNPANNTVFSINTISMNCTAFDRVNLVNVSLILDGVINETNSSGINNSLYNFDKTVSLEDHNWSCRGANNNSLFSTTGTRFFSVNISIGTELISPVNNQNFTTTNVSFVFNSTPINQDLVAGNVTIWFSNGTLALTNGTDLSGSSGVQSNLTSMLLESFYIWTASTTGTITTNTTANRTFTVHVTSPLVAITFPTGNIESFVMGDNLVLNWSITEIGQNLSAHIINCSFTYNSIETFLNLTQCIETNETTFLYVQRVDNLSFTVVDEFNLTTTNTTSWTFSVLENQIFFTNTTIEGVIETYTINVTLGSGEVISSANFSYNGTGNSVTITDIGNSMFNLTSQLTVPNVNADANLSFFWEINLVSGIQVSTSTNNQTVQNLGIDDCSVNNNTIFNYTMLDEEAQTQLSNTSFEIDLRIFNIDKTSSILNFSQSLNNTNSVTICLNIDLTNQTIYALDSVVKYSSIINYVIEYYNIQNFTLRNSTVPQNINLFELLTVDSTEFQITFKDSSFIVVENALIQINRQYVSEGVFKTVEIPRTDSNGQTVAHFVEKDIVYNIIVTKEGVVLGTFNNVIAFCEDVAVGKCFISLNALEANVPAFDYDQEIGLAFDFIYNRTSRILLFPFTTTDGSVKNVSMNGTRFDSLGNSSICGDFLVSASGTLTCTVPLSVGNETIIIDIFVDGDLKIQNYIQAGTEFDLGDAGYFLLFFLVLSFALMLSQSKIGVIVGTVLGFVAGILLFLFRGGLVGVGSSIVWLVLWAVALIWKLNSERQT